MRLTVRSCNLEILLSPKKNCLSKVMNISFCALSFKTVLIFTQQDVRVEICSELNFKLQDYEINYLMWKNTFLKSTFHHYKHLWMRWKWFWGTYFKNTFPSCFWSMEKCRTKTLHWILTTLISTIKIKSMIEDILV